MKYFKKIIGEKIYLSPLNIEDAEIYTKWLNDIKVSNGLNNTIRMNTIQSEKNWLTNETGYHFSIIKMDNDELIGNCGFNLIDNIHQIATIGIFIGEEENRNKGYGKEALNLLLDYGFNYLNLHNIMLKVFSFNENAINCYKKIGFKEFGRRRECYYMNNRRYDEINMEILKEEYVKEGK